MTGISAVLNWLSSVRTVQVPRPRIHRSYSDSALILEPTTAEIFFDPLSDDDHPNSTHRSFRSSSPSWDDSDRDDIDSAGSFTSSSELLSMLAEEFKEEKAEDCIFGRNYLFPTYSATESAVYFQPPTHCKVHRKTGYLRLQEIEDDELYTRVDVLSPIPKVTHIFHDCVVQFPPDDFLIALPITDVGAQTSARECQVCGKPVCGSGGKDSSFHRFKVFCSDECYCLYALPLPVEPVAPGSPQNDA